MAMVDVVYWQLTGGLLAQVDWQPLALFLHSLCERSALSSMAAL